MTLKKVIRATAVNAAVVMLTGCGGSNSANITAGAGPGTGSNSGSGGGTTQTIQGIATPESVAVVTATNTN
jgi:hypothetical protein